MLIMSNNRYNIYNMHKYWGKKPPEILSNVIKKYSKEGDIILDPFSGYGGVGIEGVLSNRKVILNDLNPIASFISNMILSKDVDLIKLQKYFKEIKNKYESVEKDLFYLEKNKIISILMKNDSPYKIKIKYGNKTLEKKITAKQLKKIIEQEKQIINNFWFPTNELIPNSRISVKKGLKISDLFSKKTLYAHSLLLNLINCLPDSNEQKLLLLAFTSNIANCSKLIPPIITRGEMSQGSWMTGFYLPKIYIENNVFHYFENRVNKILKGKKEYLEQIENEINFQIFNEDAKKLPLKDESVDLVITDFPYGDTVPYFEQSQIWNSWLGYKPEYQKEIVISDSKNRNKNINNFSKDINVSIKEINRILKKDKFFVFFFHSLSMKEWEPIINSLLESNFLFFECYMLKQKTLPPRQLCRLNSLKGDVVVVFKKQSVVVKKRNFNKIFIDTIKETKKTFFDSNEIIEYIIFSMLKSYDINSTINNTFIKIIENYFSFDESIQKWKIKILTN